MNCHIKLPLLALTLGMCIGSDATAVEPLRTNGASFRIPFAVDQSKTDSPGTAILFASKDGSAMEPIQRVASSERSFHFLAPGEGRFQFAVRMTDSQGKLIGEDGPLVPELEVVVDSTPPTVLLELAEFAAGEAILKWSFSEEDVAKDTLQIEYLESSTGVWKPVAATDPSGLAFSKQATIKSNPGQSVAVRASVKDLAGNIGSGTSQIVLSRQRGRSGSSLSFSQKFKSFKSESSQASNSGSLNIPSGGSPTILGTSPFSLSDDAKNTVPANPTAGNAIAEFSRNNSTPISMQKIREANSGTLSIPLEAPKPNATVAAANLTNSNSLGDPQFQSRPESDHEYRGLERQHMNNRLFDLAYEIDSVGPSGVSSVVLYVTEDNGRNWFRYGDDKDLKSPLKVDTRGEGTFGFAVRVRNGVGFSDPPPQPGEVPSVVVTVDQTPPALRMATPQLLTLGQGIIRLQWEIQEANPADAAVRLEYATQAEGPWSPVFDWQQNPTGFEMPVDDNLPPAIHFRLLARDQAGNVSTTQTAQAVLIDRKRPKARVLSVKPASASPGY